MSSIIVKGMEMPENCTRCDYIGLNVAIGCPVMSGTNGRATDCPLVALPDKHGQLKDADATIKEIKARNPDDVSYEDAWAITCIEHATTIVEAEDSE